MPAENFAGSCTLNFKAEVLTGLKCIVFAQPFSIGYFVSLSTGNHLPSESF